MSTFYSLITSLGLAKLTNAQINQTKVNLSHVAVGDSGGGYYEPNEGLTSLKNETWRGGVSRVEVAPDNPNWIEVDVTIPGNIGGFYIREVGIFDDTGTLIAIAKYPETYKPTVDVGSTKDLNIKIIIELNNTSSVDLKIDPHIITASRKYVDQKFGEVSNNLTSLETRVTEHLAEFVQNLSGNGYQKLPNGLILQWRTIPRNSAMSSVGGGITVSFPIVFPNEVCFIVAHTDADVYTDALRIKGSVIGGNDHMAVIVDEANILFDRTIFCLAIGW